MQIVLHIGPHKTGTTYIQHQFQNYRDKLLESGWLYPDVGCPPQMAAHHDLAHASEKYLTQNTKPLADLRDQGKNLVFSAEGFCMWGPNKYQKFQDVVRGDKVTLVYYMRDPYEVFYSYWKEEIKQGLVTSLPEKFMEHFNDPFKSRMLNPLLDIARYKKLGSDFEVKLLPYDALLRDRLDIFQTFTSNALKLKDEFPSSGQRPNQSLSIEVSEFLRVLTKDLDAERGYKRKVVRYAFYRLGLRQVSASINQAFASGMAGLRKECKLDRNNRFYRILEKQIIETYGNDFYYLPEDRKIFPEGIMSYHFYDEGDILSSKTVRPLYNDVRERVIRAIGEGSTNDEDLI